MRNEFYQHKKSDKVKWIITAVAFVLVTVMLVGICMQIFAKNEKYKPSEWFKKPAQTQPLPEEKNNDSEAFDEAEKTGTGLVKVRNLALMKSEPVVMTAATASSTYVSQTITAAITPSSVVDQYVTWSLAWKTGAALSNKNVTEYVQLTDDSQGSLTATVNAYKAFRGSDIILTCTTRQDNKSATCTITYDGVPSSLSIGKPSGVGSYNLGSDSVDLLYAGKTYTSTISMDNIFHDVGTSYNNFSVTVTGVGSYQYADYNSSPRGAGYTIDDFDSIPTKSLNSVKDQMIAVSVSGNSLRIEAKKSYVGFYESYTVNETYGNPYGVYKNKHYKSVKDSDGNDPYFLITVSHKTLGFSASYKVFIGEAVNSVSLSSASMKF